VRPAPGEVLFFASAADLRAWLSDHHASADRAWLGFHKRNSKQTGVSYAEAVDEALCFGWIDGQLSGLDETSYALRFTPRRARSVWSTANVKRVGELRRAGRMQPAGLAAFEARRPELTGVYLSDMDADSPPSELIDAFRANAAAWTFWSRQPPSYRRQMMWWVLSAKRAQTRQRRLAALVDEHAAGRRIDPLHLPRLGTR
jgi:uncharacterized protein YdeI (YjbR/CyaY-like superfamily)